MRKVASLLGNPFIILNSTFIIFLSSCSIQKQIARSANEDVLNTKALTTAHVGISIYEPAASKYWFNYQGDKYFVPASNTKLPTCYAAMKYLRDSIEGLRYLVNKSELWIVPTGDPTFLLTEYKAQPVYDFLKNTSLKIVINPEQPYINPFGSGWQIGDYNETYAAPRSIFPIYGNLVTFTIDDKRRISATPKSFSNKEHLDVDFTCAEFKTIKKLDLYENKYYLECYGAGPALKKIQVPFTPDYRKVFSEILSDTIHKQIEFRKEEPFYLNVLYSRPTDSLLKPMMHRSDNFFAEQCLVMVSNNFLGNMDESKIRDSLLKTDFRDLPQKPRWADGSGLSRYNLFTPQDFVAILNKMKNEFGMERIKVILPTGGEGTISSYYKADSGYIYGKTGTLSGVVAFSGFLYTKKGKLLIFSTLVNNHQASATEVRKAIEKFLQGVRKKY